MGSLVTSLPLRAARVVFPAELDWVRQARGDGSGTPPTPGTDAGPEAGARRVFAVDPDYIPFFVARTRVRIDKARNLLGYRPRFDLARGMAMTEAWACWAGLLDRREVHGAAAGPAATPAPAGKGGE